MDNIEKQNIAKLFSDTDLIFIPEDEDWDTAVKKYDDDVKQYGSTSIDIATAKFYVENGSADYDFWEHESILSNANANFCVEDQCWIEIYEPVDSFIQKLAEANVKLYTPNTFNEYLKSQNIPYTFDDFFWDNNE